MISNSGGTLSPPDVCAHRVGHKRLIPPFQFNRGITKADGHNASNILIPGAVNLVRTRSVRWLFIRNDRMRKGYHPTVSAVMVSAVDPGRFVRTVRLRMLLICFIDVVREMPDSNQSIRRIYVFQT